MRGAWRRAYDTEVRSHASLKGHTPLTFASGHRAARAELNNVRWVSHCRDVVQLPVAPDNEFEMDRRGSADLAAVDGGRGLLNGRLAGHDGPIIPRFASVSGRPPRPTSGLPPAHGARSRRLGRTCHRAPNSHADCHGWRRWPASAPEAGGQTPDATQRCFNPECSERIGNSRRTGERLDPEGVDFHGVCSNPGDACRFS